MQDLASVTLIDAAAGGYGGVVVVGPGWEVVGGAGVGGGRDQVPVETLIGRSGSRWISLGGRWLPTIANYERYVAGLGQDARDANGGIC